MIGHRDALLRLIWYAERYECLSEPVRECRDVLLRRARETLATLDMGECRYTLDHRVDALERRVTALERHPLPTPGAPEEGKTR